ncbi:MAG: hypothetical protein R3Y13_04230 [bacterium]
MTEYEILDKKNLYDKKTLLVIKKALDLKEESLLIHLKSIKDKLDSKKELEDSRFYNSFIESINPTIYIEQDKELHDFHDEDQLLPRKDIVNKYYNNIVKQLQDIDAEKQCPLEIFMKVNFDNFDFKNIVKETSNMNPYYYNMHDEFFFKCYRELDELPITSINPNNKDDFQNLISLFTEVQLQIINAISLRSIISKSDRQLAMISISKKVSSEEIYLEEYMIKLQRNIEKLIINCMTQNYYILLKKSGSIDELEIDKRLFELDILNKELNETITLHLANFEGVSFLPKNYTNEFIDQINNINTFVITKQYNNVKA